MGMGTVGERERRRGRRRRRSGKGPFATGDVSVARRHCVHNGNRGNGYPAPGAHLIEPLCLDEWWTMRWDLSLGRTSDALLRTALCV